MASPNGAQATILMAEAKAEGKDDYADVKGGDAKGSAAQFDANELLMTVAGKAEAHLFAPKCDLQLFVADHASEWEEAVEGEATGAGSPIKGECCRRRSR